MRRPIFHLLAASTCAILISACSGPGWISKARGIYFEQQADRAYQVEARVNDTARSYYNNAIEQFDAAIKFIPQDAACHMHKGWCERRLKDNQTALKEMSEAIALDPKDVQAWTQRGALLTEMEVYDKALEDYQQVISLAPKGALGYAGKAYCEKMNKDWKNCFSDYDKAVSLENKPYFYCERASANRAQGNVPQMYADYHRAIRLNPHNLDTYHWRGYSEMIIGDYKNAIADFKKVLQSSHWKFNDAPYAVIFGAVAAHLTDEKDDVEFFLENGTEKLELPLATSDNAHDAQVAERWPAPAIQFLHGDITAKTLLETAGKDRDRLTEAHCYIGLADLINGNHLKADNEFSWVTKNGNKNFVEYEISAQQLRNHNEAKENAQEEERANEK